MTDDDGDEERPECVDCGRTTGLVGSGGYPPMRPPRPLHHRRRTAVRTLHVTSIPCVEDDHQLCRGAWDGDDYIDTVECICPCHHE